MTTHSPLAVLLLCGALATGAEAQERIPGFPSGRTTFSLGAGVSLGSSEAGFAWEAALERQMIGRLRAELAGSYVDRGPAAEGWSARIGLLLDLEAAAVKAVPYFAAGIGVYHTDLELSGSPSGGMPAGRRSDVYVQVPAFYEERLGLSRMTDGHHHFTDPMVAIGGGLRWDVTRRLFLRPDGRALLVLSHHDTLVVGVLTINVALKFCGTSRG
jgi:hypothetical protein